MKNLNALKIDFLIIVVILLSYAKSAPPVNKLNCSLNDLTHNYLAIADPIYDVDQKTTVPYTYNITIENAKGISASMSNIYASINRNKNLLITISKLDEKIILNEGSDYYLKFILSLRCNDGTTVQMNTVVPFIDSNNHQPFFSKPRYIYNLISTFEEDFNRQLELNPITATDYDVTNRELLFNIQANEYFDIVYAGVIPGTLNKKHLAHLVPKFPGQIITKKTVVSLTVMDVGNPPNSNTSELVINPPSPATPAFNKPFYVGHLYKNYSFETSENPQLQEGVTYYKTSVTVSSSYYTECSKYRVVITEGDMTIEKYYSGASDFYQRTYIACPLTATYTDPVTQLFSSGIASLIVEYHHDL